MSVRARRQLRDGYRFDGFSPGSSVRGVFGDPYAVVISLQRRQKKLNAASVAEGIAASTTAPSVVFGIYRALIDAFTWMWRCGGSSASPVAG